MPNTLHSKQQQLETIKLFWDLFEMLAHSSDHTAGASYDSLSTPFQQYLDEQGLPQMSADELWHDLQAETPIDENIKTANADNSAFGVKKGDRIKVYKSYFGNGETRYIGIMNSKSVDLPAVLFS